MAAELRGLLYLAGLTTWRQMWARKSIIAAVLVLLAGLAVTAWAMRRGNDLAEFGNDIIMQVFVSFLLPIFALTYATAAIADEREDRTIVYLLTRPLARWRIYLAKELGVIPIVLAVVLGSFALICFLAGYVGMLALERFLPGLALGALAYTALFVFFGAIVPRPLVVSVIYAFLVEALIGNMPGTLKRIAISFHTRCILYGAGADAGFEPDNPLQFLAISSRSAAMVLICVIVGMSLLGAWAFHRREFRDLT